jgi:two-component system response regulator AlgR
VRVVICDDDPVLREIVETLAKVRGYEVIAHAENAIEAIDAAKAGAADVVILDIALPGMSGVEAIPHIHEARPGCKVMILTAFDSEREAAVAAGAVEVFNKTELLALDAALQRLEEKAQAPAPD